MTHLRLLLALAALLCGGGALAGEWIAVVVAPKRAAATLDRSSLALIYERKRLYWPDGRKIQPLNLPAGDPLRQLFSTAVLDLAPAQIDEYWNALYFHGIRPPYVLRSVEAMLRFVAETADAIGYVALCNVDERVSVVAAIDTDGKLHTPGDAPGCETAVEPGLP